MTLEENIQTLLETRNGAGADLVGANLSGAYLN